MLGDSVNTASRLEGQSKTYGVGTVIGEDTYLQAPEYAVLELDLIAVKGRREAIRVFDLMGREAMKDDPDFVALGAAHDRMLRAYRGQDWAGARARLAECRAREADLEVLYDLYEERIDHYEQNPPDPAWDGVFVATSK